MRPLFAGAGLVQGAGLGPFGLVNEVKSLINKAKDRLCAKFMA
jgi:hypothetical protein